MADLKRRTGSQIRFLKPGEIDKSYEEDVVDIDPLHATTFIYNPNISLSYEQQRQRLPIFNFRNNILYLVEKYQTLVLVGETGCGKSTQLPQYLYEAGWCENNKLVGVTEPRRVAATTLASRVAEEKGCALGSLVGYAIRFDDKSDESTRIKFMTEGILLREMMADPLLNKFSVIVLDEVHERTVFTDVVMGLLKKILRKNSKLRLVVSSATVDAEEIQKFFNLNKSRNKEKDTSVIMSVTGRQYPVDVFYIQDPVPDYVQGVVDTVIKIHKLEAGGDILAFLTGQEEVDRAVRAIEQLTEHGKGGLELQAMPLHGSLPHRDQLRVFRPAEKGTRKAIIATNIAETSVTLRGVCYVVDSGFVKLRWYSAKDACTDALLVLPISKASAEQRAGRAGRERGGKCFRLYREQDFGALPDTTPREMQRSELSGAVLQLKALGIDNVLRFDFPSPPPAQHLLTAYELLYALSTIDDNGDLTKPLGYTMAEFPIHPLISKTLLVSGEFGCSEEILSILAILQVQSIFTKPNTGSGAIKARVAKRLFEVAQGDLLTSLNVMKAFEKNGKTREWCYKYYLHYKGLKRALEIRSQMEGLLKRFDVPIISTGNEEIIRKALTAGFFPNAAYLHHSGVYRSVRGGQELHIHPTSVFYTLEQPQWVLFCDLVYTDKNYMRNLTVIHPEWLEELAPHFYHKSTVHD